MIRAIVGIGQALQSTAPGYQGWLGRGALYCEAAAAGCDSPQVFERALAELERRRAISVIEDRVYWRGWRRARTAKERSA